MSVINIINTIVLAIGVPTIIGACIYIGTKLQILDDLKSTSDKVKQNLNTVCNFLIKNNDKFNPTELQTFSPFQLTQIGKDLISDIGFDKVFSNHKAEFFEMIDSEQPRVKYDVETSAIKAISFLYNKDFMQFLRVYFYNNPTRNLENTAPTLGVFVRDIYLSEHPEIKQ